jgi:hypothetical protein
MDEPERIAIEKRAKKLLTDCGIKAPPTPLDPLLVAKQLELFSFDVPENTAYPELKESIRAFIHVPDREIYISNQIYKKKRRFASFHEIAHYELPWHKAALYGCDEIDLSNTARKMFDIEANAFAASCMFQGDSFTDEALDHRFSMSSVMSLADRYGVSYESATRRFVERHPDPCAVVVCEPQKNSAGKKDGALALKYAIRSDSFNIRFKAGSVLSSDHFISQYCQTTHDEPIRERIVLKGAASTTLKCGAHIFYNGYRALILLKPRDFDGPGYSVPLL